MKKFIAYFDYLGFKDFILNNDIEYQTKIMHNIFRDIESALGQGKHKESPRGFTADISNSKINCTNFSDTVIFWTNNDTQESLDELLAVAYHFNWSCILYFFPIRGSIVYGDISHVDYRQSNSGGGTYNLNSLYGKGLVDSYLKAEQQNWAGTVIDDSLISELVRRGLNPDKFLEPIAKKYIVPYKALSNTEEEYVLKIIKGEIPSEYADNYRNDIKRNFAEHNKSTSHPSVIEKLENTLTYLETFVIK